MEYKSNDYLGQDYERKIELEKLTPIGRMYLGKYKPMRVDNRTIRLIKQEEQHEKQIQQY